MSRLDFTRRLRWLAVWAWSGGLAVIAADFLYLPVFHWRASAGYVLFAAAAALMAWAEKREFGTRVFLYRLHDAVIFSPWKFLLLYFLWISLFSPFTENPRASLVYAANGWLSLFAVGISAQFIFCERGSQGVVLLPGRLAIAFRIYAVTVSLLMANSLLHALLPGSPVPMLVNQQANLFFYFLMGLPFLIWDFVKSGRKLLPPWLSLATIWFGTITCLLIGRKVYFAALALALGGVLGLFLYKRFRLRRAILLGGGAAAFAFLAAALIALALESSPLSAALGNAREAMERRMRGSVVPVWEALVSSSFFGKGVGVTEFRGVWARVVAEAGAVGGFLYSAFFLALLWDLYRVRRSPRVVVSNVAALSVGIFVLLLAHYVENPYGAYVWVWYSIWALFASSPKKKGAL